MTDNQLILEYYEGDKEYPVEVLNIKPYPEYGKGYYEVLCSDAEGKFTSIVYIQNNMVVVVPGYFKNR